MKRLLIVDSSVTSRSPTMRGWLAAASKVLPQRFDEVEVWGFRCELEGSWVKWRRIKPVTSRWAIQSVFYEQTVRRMMRRQDASYRSETLVQSTGAHLETADIRYIQFWNKAFSEAAAERPRYLRLPLKDRVVGRLAIKRELEALRPGKSGEWWCVSRGIAAPIIRASQVPPVVRYLPNAYDNSRFNPAVRLRWRDEMRMFHGFAEGDIVLAFSAFGHFERKGLRQAVQAVAKLAAGARPVRLLVIGGSQAVIGSFKRRMSLADIDLSGVRFIGLQDDIERHLSAADAFFMPSHFEAFSLAEIEAAALGLRLYLTAHPGHEMVLREHQNGRLLPWDPEGMASVLDEEIRSGAIIKPHQVMGEALSPDEYADLMGRHYDAAIARKWGLDGLAR